MSFKEKWNEEDKKCQGCGQVTERAKGITKQNIKRLLIPKWDSNEVLVTLLLVLIILMAFAYQYETNLSREWIKNTTGVNLEQCIVNSKARCELINFTLEQESKVKGNNKLNYSR